MREYSPFHQRQDIANGHLDTDLTRDGGDLRVCDATWDDLGERLEGTIRVDGEAVHGDATSDTYTDGCDLSLSINPDTGTSLYTLSGDTEIRKKCDDPGFDFPYITEKFVRIANYSMRVTGSATLVV